MNIPTQAQIEAARTVIIAAKYHAAWIPDAYIRDAFMLDCDKSIAALTAAAEVGPDWKARAEEIKTSDSEELDRVYEALNIAGNESPIDAINELKAAFQRNKWPKP